jgi:glycosyltransferase involved in cell wall biosynthesis
MPAPPNFHILFVEGGLPSPRVDAGSLANLELIALIQSQGHRVTYLFTGYNPMGSSKELIELGCIAINGVGFVHDQQVALLKKYEINVAILSRPGPALQWINALKVGDVPSVYFGHDVHHVRLERAEAFNAPHTHQSKSLQSCLVHKSIEGHLWKMADVVVYPTRWECDYAMARSGRTHAVPMPIYDVESMAHLQHQISSSTNQSKRNTMQYPLLFIGGSHHAPNFDGLMWFVRDVAPKLSLPIELRVVGQWDPNAQQQLKEFARTALQERSHLTLCGSVTENELLRHYEAAALVIAPLRYGAGLKRKVVEALMFKRPLLSTPMGLEGIELDTSQLANVCSQLDPAQFAKALEARLTLPSEVQQSQSEALAQHVALQFSRSQRLESLAQIFAMLRLHQPQP